MSAMIIPVICAMVGFGLAIRPALAHDRRLRETDVQQH